MESRAGGKHRPSKGKSDEHPTYFLIIYFVNGQSIPYGSVVGEFTKPFWNILVIAASANSGGKECTRSIK